MGFLFDNEESSNVSTSVFVTCYFSNNMTMRIWNEFVRKFSVKQAYQWRSQKKIKGGAVVGRTGQRSCPGRWRRPLLGGSGGMLPREILKK